MEEISDLGKLFKATKSVQLDALGLRLHIIARPSEELLATAYLTFKHQGMAETVWHQGHTPLLSEFLKWGSQSNNCIYACMVEKLGEESIILAGLGFTVSITPVSFEEGKQEMKAEVGMAFFKEFQRDGLPEEFCEMCIDHGFESLNLLAMYGTTPMPNRVARFFHAKCGFTDIGVFPHYTSWQGKVCDASITVLTREEWAKSKPVQEPEAKEEATPPPSQPQPPPLGD